MSWLTLTFKNIGKFIRFHPLMFFFLIFAQIVCCVAVFITVGMAYNMNYTAEELPDYFCYSFTFETAQVGYNISSVKTDDGFQKFGDYYYKLTVSDPETGESRPVSHYTLENAIPISQARELVGDFLVKIADSKPYSADLYTCVSREFDSVDINPCYTFYIPVPFLSGQDKNTFDWIASDEKVFTAPVFSPDGEDNPLCPYDIGGVYEIGGESFRCVGDNNYFCMPYLAAPDSFCVTSINVWFSEPQTRDQIQQITDTANSVFGSKVLLHEEPEPYDPGAVQLSQMLFVISIIVMLIVIFAISKYYGFIMSTRHNTLSVFRLCGCSRERVCTVYLFEIILTMTATTLAALLIFRFALCEPISQLYPAFTAFYHPPEYAAVTAGYMFIAVIIMFVTVRLSLPPKHWYNNTQEMMI